MSVALRGSLEDFGIAEVFQLIGQHCKTGVLELAGNGQKMHLAFENGSVVWAAPVGASYDAVLGEWLVRCGLLTPDKLSQLLHQGEASARSLAVLAVSEVDIAQEEVQEIVDLMTRETIFEVLRWDGGSFDFSAQPVQHNQPPEKVLGAEQILMDGLRMVDEWHAFKEAVPSEDIVFGSAERFDVFRQQASGYSKEGLVQAESVFQLVDGRLSVRRIMDLSRLGTFEATRILAELRKYGLIEPLDPGRVRSLRRRSRPSTPVAERVRWGLAVVFPIALLSLIVSLLFTSAPGGPARPGFFPIERLPLQKVEDAFEKRRVRHVIEAHRFLWSSWPEGLDEPDRTALLGRPTLTPSQARPYYYARSEEGVILLAPER